MKTMIAACLLLAGCSDRQNLGDTSQVLAHTRWAITLGDLGHDEGRSAAIDPSGDVIAAGYFEGTVDFGGHTLTAPPHGAGWVSKRSGGDGHELWTLGFVPDASGLAEVMDVATADDGSVLVTGVYVGDLGLGSQTLHSTMGACFLAKYDTSGQLVWARDLATTGPVSYTQAYALAAGHDGRSAMVGVYKGTIQFPNTTATADADQEPFVVLFDTNGQMVWGAVGVGGVAVSVAMTSEDDVIVNGDLGEAGTFAGTPLQASAIQTQFAARFTVDGNLLWTRAFGTSGVSRSAGPVAVAIDGAPVLTSTTHADTDLRTNGEPQIEALDPNGNPMWTSDAVSGSGLADSMAVLADGTIVTGGYTAGFPIDFGSGTLDGCMYLAAHDRDGSLVAARSFILGPTNCGSDIPWKLAAGHGGALVFTGLVDRPVDFGTGTLRFAGTTDAMIVMLDTAEATP